MMKFSACGVGDVSQSYLDRPLNLIIICNGRIFETEYCPEDKDGWQNSTWDDLVKFVRQTTSTIPVSITYEDEENDLVTFSSDAEWYEAMKVAARDGYIICLNVSGEPEVDDESHCFKQSSNIITPKQLGEFPHDVVSDLEEVGSETRSGVASSTQGSSSLEFNPEVPAWFSAYMTKFKEDVTNSVHNAIASRRWRQLLKDKQCAMCIRKLNDTVCSHCEPLYTALFNGGDCATLVNQLYPDRGSAKSKIQRLPLKSPQVMEHNLASAMNRGMMGKVRRANEERASASDEKPLKSMDAEFLYDETVPDAAKFLPGTTFVKTWRVVNTGTEQWNSNTKLKFLWGSKGFTPVQTMSDVSPLKPGEVGSVSVVYRAPNKPGHYESHWNFTHHNRLFGHRVWCVIEVVDPGIFSRAYRRELVCPDALLEKEPESGERQAPPETVLSGDEQDDAGLSAPETSSNVSVVSSKVSENLEIISNADSDDDEYEFNLSGRNSITDSDLASVLSVGSLDNSLDYVMVPMPSCFVIPADLTEDNEAGAIDPRPAVVKGNANSSSSSVVFIASDGEESVPDTTTCESQSPLMTVITGAAVADGLPSNKTEAKKKVDFDVVSISSSIAESDSDGDSNGGHKEDDLTFGHRKRSAETGERVADKIEEDASVVVLPHVNVGVQVLDGQDYVQKVHAMAAANPNGRVKSKPSDEDVADQMVHVLPEGLVNAAASVYNSAKSAISAIQNAASAAASSNSEANRAQHPDQNDLAQHCCPKGKTNTIACSRHQVAAIAASGLLHAVPKSQFNDDIELVDVPDVDPEELEVVLIKFKDMGIWIDSETAKKLIVKHNGHMHAIINEVLNIHVDNNWISHRH